MKEIPAQLRRPKNESAPGDHGNMAASLKGFLQSKFLAALTAFVAVGAVWSQARLGVLSPTDFAVTTWTACAVEDFLSNDHPRPQIALVGSSLMLAPVGGVDADFLKQEIDAPRHHRSLYLEDQYKKLTGKAVTTFNFALPGEMPSDAYLITRFLLRNEKKPDVLVYGVGPRDFMDNLLPSPAATDPFLYLSRLGDISDHFKAYSTDWQQRLSFELGRLFYTYGHKGDLTTSCERLVAHAVTPHLPQVDSVEAMAFRRKVMPNYHFFEVAKGESKFRPTTPESRSAFADNRAEYRDRYKHLKWDTYLSQMKFMSEILNIAKQREIHVVVVAMPITDLNRELLGEHKWSIYRQGIKVLAQAKGASFVDLDGSGIFELKDFGDTVHLHSGGGAKLLTAIARSLSRDESAKTALVVPPLSTPQELAGLKETRL